MRIRIYYECLEQALHYIKPILERKTEIPIDLVRRPRSSTNTNGGVIGAIYQLTTPDFLITLCDEDVEIPLILGEFSESVLTEDHELQRAIGGIAAAITNSIYLKISGEKISEREHGGKKDFNPLSVARAFAERFDYMGFIVSKWDTQGDNQYILSRNREYTSCPAFGAAPLAEFIMENVAGLISKNNLQKIKNNFSEFFMTHNSSKPFLIRYGSMLSSAPSPEETFSDWEGRRPRKGWRRVEVGKNELIIKINRFSHAADPDRGILLYLSSISDKDKILARYCVKDYRGSSSKGLVDAFFKQAKEEGFPVETIFDRKIVGNKLDVTRKILAHKDRIRSNKVLFSILFFSDGMVIHSESNSKKFMLKWDRKRLFGIERSNIYLALKETLDANVVKPPLSIERAEDLTEDEITYVAVHRILKPNKFAIISVSFPGAQGEAAVLPDRIHGRGQTRMYIDVIAWLPKEYKDEIALEEVKESFDGGIEADVEKLLTFKTDAKKRNALSETLIRLGQKTPKKIVVGIAFGIRNNKSITWNPKDVDFIVRMDKNSWQVASFGERFKHCFEKCEGVPNLPVRFKVVAEK